MKNMDLIISMKVYLERRKLTLEKEKQIINEFIRELEREEKNK